jgi:hypothetical protein
LEALPDVLGVKAGTLKAASKCFPLLDFHVASAQPWARMGPRLPGKHGAARG